MNANHNILILGNFMWYVDSRQLIRVEDAVSKNGHEPILLTNRQEQLLKCLLSAHPKTLSKQQIIEQIWGTQHISQESLPQLIIRTRQTLEDTTKQILENKVGIGYQLNFSTIEESEIDEKKINGENLSIQDKRERYWFSASILLIAVTLFNVWNYFSAVIHKSEIQEVLRAKAYPYITRVDKDSITISIDNRECLYDRTQFLLTCK
ncbi:winged helix family transcriptional regulator [Vibrio vulnificus]|nr:winged helix family transcriptional regulator [Vibrio vulnificus]